MITEVVTWKMPKEMTREQLTAAFRKSVPYWQQNSALIRKSFIFDPVNGTCGGIYLWNSVDDAKRFHDDAFCKRINDVYGGKPSFTYYETSIAIDNASGTVTDEGVGS